MSGPTCCNCRAGFFPVVLLGILICGVVPAFGQSSWYDGAGVAGDLFGQALTEVPDMNGDGLAEFLVGIPGNSAAGLDAGRAFFWYGGDHVTLAPDLEIVGQSPEQLGYAVAWIGDVNNDGDPDFAVGAPMSNTAGAAAGRVLIFYGGPGLDATPDDVILGAAGGERFGFSISAAGDFDGDNVDDFIVGAPYSDLRGLDAGAAYVIYGSGTGPSTDLADATVLAGEVAGDLFGWSVSDAGDFLGGPRDCVAVGAPLSNTHGGLDAGAVFVFEGDATPDTTIDWVAGISAASKANSRFGFCVRNAGNLDGDAYDDLAVGAPYCSQVGSETGRVEFFLGDPSPAVTPDHAVDGQASGGHFGWSLDGIGNYAGTSLDDVLIGAPHVSLDASDAGRAYVYRGGSTATGAAALDVILNDPILAGTAADDMFGYAVSSAGDFDGDGQLDVAIGAPGGNAGASVAPAGFVRLLHTTAGPVPALLRKWSATWQGADRVELAFRLSLDPARLADVRILRRAAAGLGEDQLWSGPARPGDDGRDGILFHDGDGFVFRDGAPGSGEPSYALALTTDDGAAVRLDALAGPGTPPVLAPTVLALRPVWPNPANPAVTISFRAAAGTATSVRILDVRGHVVRSLAVPAATGDWQELVWRGDTDAGRAAPSGVYLVRVGAGAETQTRRFTLAR